MKFAGILQPIRSTSEKKRQASKEKEKVDMKQKLPQLQKQVASQSTLKKPPMQRTRKIMNSKTNRIEGFHLYCSSQSKAGFDGYFDKTNQDREFTELIDNEQGVFCVMDGHGSDGEDVSQFVKDYLQQLSIKEFKGIDFIKLFQGAHKDVIAQSHFDSHMSGTTTTLLQIKDQIIHCAWVGDSRAIVCQKTQDSHISKELSIDHKPHLEKEKKRIENSGGAVDTYRLPNGMPVGPSRVYLKGATFPGLAMSRSIGDQIAGQVGVSHIPDITKHVINKEDLYIIIGSDGLWEFLENNLIAEMVYPFYVSNDPQGACQKLIQEATDAWKRYSEGVDDITVVVIFIQHNSLL